ncbi:MAG: ATP-dependent DNA helicase [Acidobacteria bacterium]|nr:ATP-dependent DNA helicase [Acidobacteriota bacterium]
MAPRFDSNSLRVELAVADLIDASLFRHLGFGQRGGYERMWVGQAIHSRYQEEARREDPSYRAEVPIRVVLQQRGWEVVIRGRIDGLRREATGDSPDDERTILEEIKSVRRGSELTDAKREIYERQARLYAWMLSLGDRGDSGDSGSDGAVAEAEAGEASDLEPPKSGQMPSEQIPFQQIPPEQIGAELVLIEIGSHKVHREPLEIDFEAIAASVERRLNRLILDYERHREVALERRQAGERLLFPYPELRNGQQAIIDATATALEQQEHLLLEAPTGLGKTVAALYPALKYALERQKRVFVLTAKTLQQDMATAVLELLNRDGTFRSLRLRAKSKMCANEEVICHEEFCPYAKDYYLKLHRSRIIDDLLMRYETLQPDAIFAHARQQEVCPFEVSLELSEKAQVVVCDYNYAFDPYVALQEFGPENDLQDTVLVVDEIHNLVDRGRGYYSPRLSTGKALEAAEFLHSISHDAPQRAARVCHELATWIADTTDHVLADVGGLQAGSAGSPGSPGSETQAAETRFVEDDLWDLRPGFDDTFVDYVEYQRQTSTYRAEDPFVDLYFDFLRFLDGLVFARTDAFSQYVRRDGDSRSVNILCKDPSRFIGGVINRTHSTIGLSATLSPTDFYRDLLGFDPERTTVTSIASPFPSENRCFVIDNSISTLWRERDRNYQPIADSLSRLAQAVPGNCLALFPSYAFIGQVAPKLAVSGKRVLVQGRDDSDQTRQEILELLRSPIAGDNLLLAVAGGVFAEGVDYPGDILRAVAIIGPCLPAVTLERELLKIYYQERFDRGFEYAFVVPGMTRVVQAAGRLIRSSEDTGVIALLDQRFLKTPYRNHLPEDWYDGGRLEDLIAQPGEAATRFFAQLPVSRA